jgi:hypothetical protein
LIFQDEVEIHRHPTLAQMWAPVGQQPEVPAPGKNQKKVVYGGVNYKTGKRNRSRDKSHIGGTLHNKCVFEKAWQGKKNAATM